MKNSLVMILLSLSAVYFLCSGCEKSDISNQELLAWQNASGGTSLLYPFVLAAGYVVKRRSA